MLKRSRASRATATTPRVRVAQIAMDYLAYGWSVDEMCRQHAYLQPAEADAAMAYYFDHQEEIDGEIESEVKEAASARANAPAPPLNWSNGQGTAVDGGAIIHGCACPVANHRAVAASRRRCVNGH